VLGQMNVVPGPLRVRKGHQDDVAALLERHGFGVTVWVTCESSQLIETYSLSMSVGAYQ
jgi:hypothetical protein